MKEEKYNVGDVVRLTYMSPGRKQQVETQINKLELWGLWLPLGCKSAISYYLFNEFGEKLRMENNQLIVEKK